MMLIAYAIIVVLCGHQVYECQRVEYAFTSPVRTECDMFVVRGCAASRRYIHVCNCDMLSVVNVYLDHLRFCVVCNNCRMYVYCSECNVSNECTEPTPALCNLYVRTVGKLCTFGVFAVGVSFVSGIVMIYACVL